MIPQPFFSQLMVVGLLWLWVMLSDAGPRPGPPSARHRAQPL